MRAALLGSLLAVAALAAWHVSQVRSDCRVIYTLSKMVESREAMLSHHHEGPLLSAEITDRCKRYGVDFSTGNR